jgi:hypothetical protein
LRTTNAVYASYQDGILAKNRIFQTKYMIISIQALRPQFWPW